VFAQPYCEAGTDYNYFFNLIVNAAPFEPAQVLYYCGHISRHLAVALPITCMISILKIKSSFELLSCLTSISGRTKTLFRCLMRFYVYF